MIGNNTLELNQATMIEALQLWLNSKWKGEHTPKVVSVRVCTGYDKGTFNIELTTDEP